MPSNSAAWLVAEKVKPLEIKDAPYTSPGDNEILVKNAAVAVNPVDWVLQEAAIFPLQYPNIQGEDIAGEVVEVGNSVTNFKKGDRVLGFATGTTDRKPNQGAFQQYTIIHPELASVIPDTLAFDRAAVLPLCVATAAAALYQDSHLHLQYPSLNAKSLDKSLFIWGGASSVGSNGIQLAVASGYKVLTTASSKNFDYVKKLGASQVFDYNKDSVIEDVVAALDNSSTEVVGIFDAVNANGAVEACVELSSRAKAKLFIATVRQPPKDLPSGVEVKYCMARGITDNDVAKAVFGDFLPKALADGKYMAAPDPHVVGKGLENVQAGFDMLKAGVSAKKVVITL